MRKSIILALLALLIACPAHAAVTRVVIDRAWYTENLPSGEWAAAVPGSHVETHLGTIPLPPQEVLALGLGPLYLRVSNVGGFQFAGQSHGLGHTWHYRQGEWEYIPRVAHGVSGAIFDLFGVLHLATPAIGSQGWRYVEQGTNRLVTGDETYGSPLRLSEWTQHGDITIGQGHTHVGGAVAVYQGRRVVLEPGHTTFVRFNRQGNRLAVAMAKMTEGRAVLLWLDVADLASFPVEPEPVIIAPPAPTPNPTPAPIPTPNPAPEPQPEPASLIEDVRAARAAIPGSPNKAQLGAMLNAIAWTHRAAGWGLSSKPSGNNCPDPAGRPIACDILQIGTDLYDVLRDEDGAAEPQWGKTTHHGNDAGRPWLAPVEPSGTPPVTPPVTPPPPVCGYPDLRLELEACGRHGRQMDEQLREMREALNQQWQRADALEHERNEALAELDRLKGKQPSCRASLFGVRVPCTVIWP